MELTNRNVGGCSSMLTTSPFSNDHSWKSVINPHQHHQTQYDQHQFHPSATHQGDWRHKVNHLKKFFGEEHSPMQQQQQQQSMTSHYYQKDHSQSPQNYQQSFNTMLESALQKTLIREKCEEVSKVLPLMSVTELRDIFCHLLHVIFGYENNPGWGLNYLEPKMYSSDFRILLEFLSPIGPLFNAIDRLLTDTDAVFHFPFNSLPSGVNEAISKNQIPPWYQTRISTNPRGTVVISMNAFEYYFSIFSYFCIHPKILQQIIDWSGVEDVLYVRLLEGYLSQYLPYDGIKFQATSATSSPTFSPKQQQHSALKTSLWRSPEMTHKSVGHQATFHLESSQHLPSKAETFLQILTDFWLAFNSEEYIQQEEEYKLPSIDHARMVRILIKYLHTFNNATNTNIVQTFGHGTDHFESDDFQNVFIPMILHNKLYGYLTHCFKHWPLDGTFRMVLETWLSFVQPWRYKNMNVSIDDSTEDITHWKKFICNNLHFYSNILSTFLLRALKHDLMLLEDVQLVFRVCKVFSQPTLREILQEKMEDITSDGNRTSFTTTFNLKTRPFAQHQPGSPFKNAPQYSLNAQQSLFSPENMSHAQELCHRLSSTIAALRHKIMVTTDNKTNKGSSSWLASLKEMFSMDDDLNYDGQRNETRLIEYLEQSCSMLTQLFKFPELPINESDNPIMGLPRPMTSQLHNDNDDGTLPEYIIDQNRIELTDRGRYQIIQGLRKFQFGYSGDPELQPIRSFESPCTVRLMYRISRRLNKKYSQKLKEYYNRQDVTGNILRKISRGLQNGQLFCSSIKLPDLRQTIPPTGELQPRISLRFAGSYYFMGYVCWGIVLARLFGFGWIAVTLMVLCVVLFSVIYHVDNPPRKFSND